MLKELGLGRYRIIGLDLWSQTKKLVVDDDRRIQLPDVRTLDHSSPACFLIPPVVQGIPLRLVADPKKDALSGVDGFLGPASLKAKRIEIRFRWQGFALPLIYMLGLSRQDRLCEVRHARDGGSFPYRLSGRSIEVGASL
jgi:hypothetical protein